MTVKCNLCLEADMNHEMVLTSEHGAMEIVRQGTEAYKLLSTHVATVNSQTSPEGLHITHIYNCEECPNSQVEYYQPNDAIAYARAMTTVSKL